MATNENVDEETETENEDITVQNRHQTSIPVNGVLAQPKPTDAATKNRHQTTEPVD